MNPMGNEPWQLAHSTKTSGIRTRERRESVGLLRGTSKTAKASSPRIWGREANAQECERQGTGEPAKGHEQNGKAQGHDGGVGGRQKQRAGADLVIEIGRGQAPAQVEHQVGPELGQPLVVDVGPRVIGIRLRKILVGRQALVLGDPLTEPEMGPDVRVPDPLTGQKDEHQPEGNHRHQGAGPQVKRSKPRSGVGQVQPGARGQSGVAVRIPGVDLGVGTVHTVILTN
jgi:hypothetical protein